MEEFLKDPKPWHTDCYECRLHNPSFEYIYKPLWNAKRIAAMHIYFSCPRLETTYPHCKKIHDFVDKMHNEGEITLHEVNEERPHFTKGRHSSSSTATRYY